MPIELLVFLFALVPVVMRGVIGWRGGATLELRHTLVYLFALLAALRYWKAGTETALGFFPSNPQIVATVVFLLVYLVGALVAGLIVNLRGEFFQSVIPNPLDHALGAVSGVLSGLLLGSVLILLTAFFMPGRIAGFDAARIPARFDRFPVLVFQWAESQVAGIPPGSPAQTQFPVAAAPLDPSPPMPPPPKS